MDALGPLLQAIGGPAMGAALVLLVKALASAIKRRGESGAAAEEANAKAVVQLVVQLGDLRRDLEREVAARLKLEAEVVSMREQLEQAESSRQHYESQVHILTQELAQLRSQHEETKGERDTLRSEVDRLYRDIVSGFHGLSIKPPKGFIP